MPAFCLLPAQRLPEFAHLRGSAALQVAAAVLEFGLACLRQGSPDFTFYAWVTKARSHMHWSLLEHALPATYILCTTE